MAGPVPPPGEPRRDRPISPAGSEGSSIPDEELLDLLGELPYLRVECEVVVPKGRSIGDIVHLWEEQGPGGGIPDRIDFDAFSNVKTGAVLEEVLLEDKAMLPGFREAHCRFDTESRSRAVFAWDHNPNTGEVYMAEAYRGRLPSWIRVGSEEKWLHSTRGVPTAKAMKVLLFHKLDLSKQNVRAAFSCAMNAQTDVDLLHGVLIEGKNQSEALAQTQTVALMAELGEMLGYKETVLRSVSADTPGAWTTLPAALEQTAWTAEQQAVFASQPKIKELQDAGFDVMSPEFKVPDALVMRVSFRDAPSE